MIEEKLFREDLFYRLNVLPIFLPPLRDRIDDIPSLVQYVIKKVSKSHSNSNIQSISDSTLNILRAYKWPGNIRELENVIERAFFYESSTEISVSSLPEHMRTLIADSVGFASAGKSLKNGASGLDYDIFKEQSEKEFIISALKANKGRINQTVAQANIPKNTLLRKIKKYGIIVDEYK
jgi:transcriptional regulator with PAS, ATPase and Fis domain